MKQRKRTSVAIPAKGRLRDFCDRLWSKAVLSDWNYRCAVCAKTATDAHHLVPRQCSALRYDLENGLALCQYCHIWNPAISPHQNAAAWMQFLSEELPSSYDWLVANHGRSFIGKKNAAYYCSVIRLLQPYVEEADCTAIVGVRFSTWLEDNDATPNP